MSREADFATRMAADSTLTSILTGGVYQAGTVGRLGITRESVPGAFDTAGYLRPCALVRQRGAVSDGIVRDPIARVTSTVQTVEIWLYEDSGYTAIDAAIARLHALFEGIVLADSFEIWLTNVIDRQRDNGALGGASLARLDFAVYSVMGA